MKYRVREEFDPKYPNLLFYYVERKILGLWWEIRMTVSLETALTIYQACIDPQFNSGCVNKIIVTYP